MPGDTIVSINGDSVSHWAMFQTRIYINPNKVLELVVERDGRLETLLVKPDAEPAGVRGDRGVLSVSSKRETIVDHVRDGSLAAQAGIQVGDQIESINGERLYNVPSFGYFVWHPSANWIAEKYQALHERINANPEALVLGIRRGDETFTLEMPVHWRVIAAVQKGSIAENAGIRNGDVLVTLNKEEIDKTTLYAQLKAKAHEPIEIGLMRDGNLQKVVLAAEKQSPEETKTDGLLFGLAWQSFLSGMEFSEKAAPLPAYNLFTGFGKGIEATWLTFTTVGKTLKQLIGGEVSPKHLAGPIGIAEATSRMFDRVGLSSVLFFIGFISINLCIVNLLPIPIADGGHLLFFAVEKIRGRPMPRKAQEVVQQVSIVLLIALFLYITWFDGMSLIFDPRN